MQLEYKRAVTINVIKKGQQMKTEAKKKGMMKEVLLKVVMYVAVMMLCMINTYINANAEKISVGEDVEISREAKNMYCGYGKVITGILEAERR